MAKTAKKKLTPADYARWVADIIEAKPSEYDQDWYYKKGSVNCGSQAIYYHCSSTCCIAGWLAACGVEAGDAEPNDRVDEIAPRLLGLEYFAEGLFQSEPRKWPEKYRIKYFSARERQSKLGMARAAAALLRNGCQEDGSWRMPE